MSYGAHASCTATPVNLGSTPIASIAFVPRFACTASSTSVGVDAECSQARRPATRMPVSSKPATGAPAIRPAITGNTVAMMPSAVRFTQPATVPAATGTPNRSLTAAAVRDTDRNCPCSRYTPIPASLGPYTIGAVASAGAAAVVWCPHRHLRVII